MIKFNLIIADDVDIDIEEAIERKKEYGAYQSTIYELLKEINSCYTKLESSPKSGSNLSARVSRETNIKYLLVKDYVMIYEITGEEEVTIYRFLSARTNWINTV
ncbi:MAG: type II toxin-antitoxin system RelE/ParE family toxin [Defluviitaleaceae bacterium]|nr:type II toxin-antitoxin system RelE/ParE family toxin [Defluviitaleaceae bacterium]